MTRWVTRLWVRLALWCRDTIARYYGVARTFDPWADEAEAKLDDTAWQLRMLEAKWPPSHRSERR